MGMDLYNSKGEYFRFNGIEWGYILHLAYEHGWEAPGTIREVMTNSPKVVGHKIEPVTRRETLFNFDEDEYTEEELNEIVSRRKVVIYDPEFAPEYETDSESYYFTNDGQLVTKDDALAIADALDKAVEKLSAPRIEPSTDFSEESIDGRMTDEDLIIFAGTSSENVVRKLATNYRVPPVEYWSTAPERVIEFAEFCRHGEFRID